MDAPNTPAPENTPPTTPGQGLFSLLPDDMKSSPGLAKFEKADIPTFAKSYIELDKLRNERTGIKPITAESTPEEVTAYRAAMGVPEKPDGYEVGELAYPEEYAPSTEQLAGFRQVAHSLHLTPAQVQGILQWHAQDTSSAWNGIRDAQDTANRTALDSLTKKYGADAPKIIMAAHEYVKRRWGDAGIAALDFGPVGKSSLGSSPLLVEILMESAKLTGHDKFIVGDSAGGLMSQEAARAKHDELSRAYYNSQDDGEKARLRGEMQRLERLAFS